MCYILELKYIPQVYYQWDIDLMNVSNLKRNNKQTTFLLVAIDILSRFLWVRALKKKTGDSVVSAFKHILAQA